MANPSSSSHVLCNSYNFFFSNLLNLPIFLIMFWIICWRCLGCESSLGEKKKMTEMVVGVSIYTVNGDPHRDYPVWCPTDGNFFPARIGTRINISSQTWRGRGWGFFPLSGVPDLRKLQNCSYILRKPNNSIHPVPSPLVASHLRV